MRSSVVSLISSVCLLVVLAPASGSARPAEYYEGMLGKLRTELKSALPKPDDEKEVHKLLASDKLDAKLVKLVVLHEATPQGLADFSNQGPEQQALVDELLADTKLMKQMLVADGLKGDTRRSMPAPYGEAMQILSDIQKAGKKAGDGVLQRLAVATALEFAEPGTEVSRSHGPVKMYLHYEKAYLAGELDPGFPTHDTWHLRWVMRGHYGPEERAWGREVLRNYRPDHILTDNHSRRYTGVVSSNIPNSSARVKFDRPELSGAQNVLMNAGICGRRAFFGQFIARAFGVPAVKRPSRGHGAMARWTPKGWVVNLGPGWGAGSTLTGYGRAANFLATTQARTNPDAYMKVKRAQWIGTVMGEERNYGGSGKKPDQWHAIALSVSEQIVKDLKAEVLDPVGAYDDDAVEVTLAEGVKDGEIEASDKKISLGADGVITIPAIAHDPMEETRQVVPMKSFAGGMQLYLPGFGRDGVTILRGGSYKSNEDGCSPGHRMQCARMGNYPNWGFRVALTPTDGETAKELSLDLGQGITMDFIRIKPGKFIMGGVNEKQNGRFDCVELPKHEVTITRPYYIGKFEVTRGQILAAQGKENASTMKEGNHPAGGISFDDALWICSLMSEKTGRQVRLPTEAEWEHAARAGTKTNWFFGDDPAKLSEYATCKYNSGLKSNPVGSRKPNPWGVHDMFGNVWEHVSDIYDPEYYAQGPKVDPAGPGNDPRSHLAYTVQVPKAGRYELSAKTVAVNFEQTIDVAVNEAPVAARLQLPYSMSGSWQDCEPVVVELKAGENVLKFCRSDPPQYGIALKSFMLKPVD